MHDDARGGTRRAAAEREAFERAVGAMARRERTTVELADWLQARGFEPAIVTAVVDRLVAIGELDDARFAKRFAEDKRELRGWGADRIRDALIVRGLPREEIDAAIGGGSTQDELHRACRLLAEAGQPLGDDAARARALGFLVRRGYESEVAYEAIRRSRREAA